VRREGEAVRLFTRRGHDWTDRYPAIAEAAAKLRAKSFTLDGEAVVAGADGIAVFDPLHRRHKATDAMLYNRGCPEIPGKARSAQPTRRRHHGRAWQAASSTAIRAVASRAAISSAVVLSTSAMSRSHRSRSPSKSAR
jgi:ATP dependent DNA ligase domain